MAEKTEAEKLADREAKIAEREAKHAQDVESLAKREAAVAAREGGDRIAASELSPLEIPTPTPTQAEIDAAKLGLHGKEREKYLTRDAKAG